MINRSGSQSSFLSSFLQSAGLIFISNILVAIFNYTIVAVASRKLIDSYSLWTALSGLIAILSTPANGVYTSVTRTSASLSKTGLSNQSLSQVKSYFWAYQKKVMSYWKIAIVLLPFLAYLLVVVISGISYWIALLTISYLMLSVYFGIHHNVLLGLLKIREYALTNTISACIRLVVAVSLILMGGQIWALPIGLMINSIAIYFLGSYFLKQVYLTFAVRTTGTTSTLIIDLQEEIISIFFTTGGIFLLNTLLYIGTITVQNSSLSIESKDILAIFFNFGQIIHFGSIAALGALVAQAAHTNSKKIYFVSLSMTLGATVVITGGFYLGGSTILNLFGRPQYTWLIGFIPLYAVFICLYNIIYVSVQYLIAQHSYRPILWLLVGIVAIISFPFTSKYIVLSQGLDLDFVRFIMLSILAGIITAVPLTTCVLRSKSE